MLALALFAGAAGCQSSGRTADGVEARPPAARPEWPHGGHGALGMSVEASEERDLYLVVDHVRHDDVLYAGSLEDCESRWLAALEAAYGTGHWNLPFPTLGGKQLWQDRHAFAGWRIQEHVYSGQCRLLDPSDIRRAWGSYEGCRVALEKVRRERGLRLRSDHLVVLLHGLGRSKDSFRRMHRALLRAGYEVAALNYPRTRGPIENLVRPIEDILAESPGIRTVSFVTHSLGGLVVRELLARQGEWRRRIHVHRLVMLAPPNGGSLIAQVVKDWFLFRLVWGETGRQLAPEGTREIPLPPCEFGIIAGGRGDARGYNPFLPGDDDGLITVRTTRLEGMADFLLVRSLHGTIIGKDEVIEAALAFLRAGRFRPQVESRLETDRGASQELARSHGR